MQSRIGYEGVDVWNEGTRVKKWNVLLYDTPVRAERQLAADHLLSPTTYRQ